MLDAASTMIEVLAIVRKNVNDIELHMKNKVGRVEMEPDVE